MIKQRLLDICAVLNISASEMSTSIGMSRPYIANLKKDITTEVLLNIHIKYPSVNIMRIITGEGDVLLSNQDWKINDSFFRDKYNQLEAENKRLLLEMGELKGELKAIKKRVQEEGNVDGGLFHYDDDLESLLQYLARNVENIKDEFYE